MWRHLNLWFRFTTSFIIMVVTAFYSSFLGKPFEKEKSDTSNVIFTITAALASIYAARHISLLEDLNFYFTRLFIGYV